MAEDIIGAHPMRPDRLRRTVIELDDTIRSASDGNGLLFVGAGLSFLARRKDNGEAVPDAACLADWLLEQPAAGGYGDSLPDRPEP